MDNMENFKISLRIITEDNFIEAFNLKLANGQERFVSHPIRSLAQAYVYRNQCLQNLNLLCFFSLVKEKAL